MLSTRAETRSLPFHSNVRLVAPDASAAMRKMSSCELLGIDAYAEDDLGFAPS